MNVFMGYNPTVAKQVKVSVWVKEIDGAEPIFPATPKDGDCFIVFDTDDDVLADNPSSKKSYANGSWGDAGGGGGGIDVPTFSVRGGHYSCDMTYEEAKASYVATVDSKGYGLAYRLVYKSGNSEEKAWGYDVLASGEMLSYFEIPETVNEGLAVLGEDSIPKTLFADDGNFYGVNQ